MPHPENIIPPKKGEIRNPKGKPIGTKNRSTILRKWIEVQTKLKNPITKVEEIGTIEDMLALALLKKGMEGDVSAIREAYDTLYGKIKEKLDVEMDQRINITKINYIVPNGNNDKADK